MSTPYVVMYPYRDTKKMPVYRHIWKALLAYAIGFVPVCILTFLFPDSIPTVWSKRPVATYGAVIWWIAGFSAFLHAFHFYKLRRTICDIPTSKMSTGALGTYVEVKGKVPMDSEIPLKGPISNTPCGFFYVYFYLNEHNSFSFYSDDCFFLEDESNGYALVFPSESEIDLKRSKHTYNGTLDDDSAPETLKAFINRDPNMMEGLVGSDPKKPRRYSVTEYCFEPDEEIYVLGYADSRFPVKENQVAEIKKLSDSVATKPDANPPREQENLSSEKLNKLREEIRPHSSADQFEHMLSKTKMVFSSLKVQEKPFIISNKTERAMEESLDWQALYHLLLGPIFYFLGVWMMYMLNR